MKRLLKRHAIDKCALLLAALVGLFVVLPNLPGNEHPLAGVFVCLVLVTGIFSVVDRRDVFAAAIVLGILFSAERFGTDHQRAPTVRDRGDRVADRKPAVPRSVPAPAVRPDVRVTVDDPSSAILVSKATRSANVSIVMIYPTVKPARATNGPLAD